MVANVRLGLAFNHSSKPLKSLAGTAFLAEITNGLMETSGQRLKSATGSYWQLRIGGAGHDVRTVLAQTDRVAVGRRARGPGGAERPPAPVTFSTTTACPSVIRIRSASTREMMSVVPPAA